MRKLLARWGNSEFGAIGIGAMIVFIAMVLVAGVAASVIISSSNSVQLQALATGQETTKEVSSGLSVFGIAGKVNVTGGTNYDMRYLCITVKARPGSGGIDLNNTYILVSDGTTKALVKYGHQNASLIFVAKADADGDLFGLLSEEDWNETNYEKFGIAVLQDYDSSMTQFNPVINRGDKAVLFVRCSDIGGTAVSDGYFPGVFGQELPERTDVFGRIIPEAGYPGVISFTSPMSYVDTIYNVQ